MARTKVIEGVALAAGRPCAVDNPVVSVPGSCAGERRELQLGRDELCRQIGLLGATGSGKTNALRAIVRDIRDSLDDGGLLVFDPKGDYRDICEAKSDAVLLGEHRCTVEYNVFRDIARAGCASYGRYAAVVSGALFSGCNREGSNQDFFVDAAELLVADVLEGMMRQADREHGFRRNLTHAGLCDFLCNANSRDLVAFCEGIPGMRSTAGKLLGDGGTGQALGILAEVVRQVGRIRGALCGDSSMEDSVGVCDLLGSGRVIRLEHDVSSAGASPMLMAIIELYLKGAMEAESSRLAAPHYVVLEEMGTLPKISQLPAALTYGRSRGLSLICCAQSASQITAAYGQDDASTVLGGFQTLIAFGTNDAGTRKELAARYGDNIVERAHVGASGKIESQIDRQPVIADWHVSSLEVGEAIVCPPLPNPPYRFMFDRSV